MTATVKRRGVITGGTWCADHNKIVDHWPGEDELVEILEEDVRGGGSACNMSIDLRKLDPELAVSTIGIVGDDEDGRALLAESAAAGIEHSRLTVLPGLRTNYTDAYTSRQSGRRTHIYQAGSSGALTPDHFDFTGDNARFLHLGLPGVHAILDEKWGNDENGWVTILKKAQSAGIETNMELCSIPAERMVQIVRPCLAHLDLLIVNDFEIAALAGRDAGHEGEADASACMDSARAVLADGAMKLVIVHFPGGAIAIDRYGHETRSASVAVPPEAIIGANGAGDAFAAGVLCGLHEEWKTEDAISLGHATAAASLRGLGTTDTVVSWRECLKIASQWGWRDPI